MTIHDNIPNDVEPDLVQLRPVEPAEWAEVEGGNAAFWVAFGPLVLALLASAGRERRAPGWGPAAVRPGPPATPS